MSVCCRCQSGWVSVVALTRWRLFEGLDTYRGVVYPVDSRPNPPVCIDGCGRSEDGVPSLTTTRVCEAGRAKVRNVKERGFRIIKLRTGTVRVRVGGDKVRSPLPMTLGSCGET